MKLTKSDIDYLLRIGHHADEIPQIKEAVRKCRYTDEKGDIITAEAALKNLGDEEFLSGISRAAFHWSSGREKGKHYVTFNCSNMFR